MQTIFRFNIHARHLTFYINFLLTKGYLIMVE